MTKPFLPDRAEVVLRHVLERHANQFKDKECVLFEDGQTWTYGRALQEAYKAGNVLSDFGIKRNEHVLVFLPNGQDWIRAWWGIACLGAVVVAVNNAYKGEMLKHICSVSKAKYIVTNSAQAERIKDIDLDLEIIDPSVLSKGSTAPPPLDAPIEPWDTHVIISTSGTTGPSKLVVLPYLMTYTNGYRYFGRARQDDTLLVDHPMFHLQALGSTYVILTLGGRFVVRTVFTASRYMDVVRECGATIAGMIGTIPEFLAKSTPRPDDADNPLRAVLCAPMVGDPEAFKNRFGIDDLWNAFGMTESGPVFITRGPITSPKTCGKVRPGMEARLVDDHDIPVADGDVGELIVRTDLPWELNAGYFGDAEATARAWRNGWFHTGDLFQCDEEGNYYFVDRKKDAIRRRGENVSSAEVEREVMAYTDVSDAACVGVPGDFGEEEIKVFVVPRAGSDFDPAHLIEFLAKRMPHFMVPRFVQTLPELPRTQSAKVKKIELRGLPNDATTWDREATGIKIKK